MVISTDGVKNVVREGLEAVRSYWPLILSSGLLYLEIRNLRREISELHGAVLRLADGSSSSGFRLRRTISASTVGNDDWYSVKSLADSDEEDDEDELDEEFISEVDTLHYGSDKGIRDAWDLIKDHDHSRSVQMLWRKCRSQCSMYGQYRAGSELGDSVEMRKHFATQALQWAEEIIKRAPKLPQGYRYKEKVTNGKEIQVNLTEALKNDPTDGSSHYILGRFHFEASNLPWAVRTVANRIGMPPCSEGEALYHFDQALGSSGHDKELHLYRYKILTKLGRSDEARKAVEDGKVLPIVFRSDQPVQDELDKLWAQHYT